MAGCCRGIRHNKHRDQAHRLALLTLKVSVQHRSLISAGSGQSLDLQSPTLFITITVQWRIQKLIDDWAQVTSGWARVKLIAACFLKHASFHPFS